MKKLLSFAFLVTLSSAVAVPAMANKAMEEMVQARQGYYKLVKHNAGQLFAMAKGDMAYDAKKAAKAANNLKTLSMLDLGTLYMPGSSKEEMPGKTRALKKIWDTFPEIGKKGAAFKQAVDAMAANAGNGLDALRANAGALGGSCKGCHDNYRADTF